MNRILGGVALLMTVVSVILFRQNLELRGREIPTTAIIIPQETSDHEVLKYRNSPNQPNLSSTIPPPLSTTPATSNPPATSAIPSVSSKNPKTRGHEWRSKFVLDEVQKTIALDQQEQLRLQDMVSQYLLANQALPSRQDLIELIRQGIGDDKSTLFYEGIVAAEAEEVARSINRELAILSREAQLTPTQETLVGKALQEIDQELTPHRRKVHEVMSEVMAQHFDGDSTKLHTGYDALKKLRGDLSESRIKGVVERLKDKLPSDTLAVIVRSLNSEGEN